MQALLCIPLIFWVLVASVVAWQCVYAHHFIYLWWCCVLQPCTDRQYVPCSLPSRLCLLLMTQHWSCRMASQSPRTFTVPPWQCSNKSIQPLLSYLLWAHEADDVQDCTVEMLVVVVCRVAAHQSLQKVCNILTCGNQRYVCFPLLPLLLVGVETKVTLSNFDWCRCHYSRVIPKKKWHAVCVHSASICW